MKSILFVALIALAISSSFAVKIKGSCPKPEKPKVDYWYFSNFVRTWNVYGRSDETIPKTVHNTIDIFNLYPGKVAIIEKADTRDSNIRSQWDKYMDINIGDFDGKSYYKVYNATYDPYSFNITTSDGHRGQFWMPYLDKKTSNTAVLASCVKIDASTVDVKVWFVAKNGATTVTQEIKDIVKSLTGQELKSVCQGSFC
ncbi:uncharacterized protein LOC112539608 [Tetranychus urticae]|uniref:Lipocalin/cytosolic fatty-acid binding domain-containing protein n=1 Tax=Tetranychus urticae TaxID=32264 RepID=T1L277_TETUR|nr:uncharacterized protein LOC112539608 [Tetranychus urticae]